MLCVYCALCLVVLCYCAVWLPRCEKFHEMICIEIHYATYKLTPNNRN